MELAGIQGGRSLNQALYADLEEKLPEELNDQLQSLVLELAEHPVKLTKGPVVL
jgi:hypothetical protein